MAYSSYGCQQELRMSNSDIYLIQVVVAFEQNQFKIIPRELNETQNQGFTKNLNVNQIKWLETLYDCIISLDVDW